MHNPRVESKIPTSDAEDKDEPDMVGNIYNASVSTFKPPANENVAGGAVDNQGLMSENGTRANDVQNAAYAVTIKTLSNDDGTMCTWIN